jgi:hypothetical protein
MQPQNWISHCKILGPASETVSWYPSLGQRNPLYFFTVAVPATTKGRWSDTLEERACRKTPGIIKSQVMEQKTRSILVWVLSLLHVNFLPRRFSSFSSSSCTASLNSLMSHRFRLLLLLSLASCWSPQWQATSQIHLSSPGKSNFSWPSWGQFKVSFIILEFMSWNNTSLDRALRKNAKLKRERPAVAKRKLRTIWWWSARGASRVPLPSVNLWHDTCTHATCVPRHPSAAGSAVLFWRFLHHAVVSSLNCMTCSGKAFGTYCTCYSKCVQRLWDTANRSYWNA